MTDPIIVALTASLVREYLSRKVRLTFWLSILVVESVHTVGITVISKCVGYKYVRVNGLHLGFLYES